MPQNRLLALKLYFHSSCPPQEFTFLIARCALLGSNRRQATLARTQQCHYHKHIPITLFVLEGHVRTAKQPRAIKTRDRILREAARMFALKGFHDTKVDEIIKAAEVTSGAFFHHFKGKEDLGFAVIDHHMEERCRALDRIEKSLPTDGDNDPLDRVFRRLDAVCEMVVRRRNRKGGCLIGNLSTTLSDTHPAFRKRLGECFDEMALEFRGSPGRGCGELRFVGVIRTR